MSAGWLPILMAGLIAAPQRPSNYTPSHLRPHQVIYRHKDKAGVRHEMRLDFERESDCKPFVEARGMVLLPHRYRVADQDGTFPDFWDEAKPNPIYAAYAKEKNQ